MSAQLRSPTFAGGMQMDATQLQCESLPWQSGIAELVEHGKSILFYT
jgi:hypothetical protein